MKIFHWRSESTAGFHLADHRNGLRSFEQTKVECVCWSKTRRGPRRRGTTKGGRGRGGEWATLSDEPASREIDSSILCAAARGLVPPWNPSNEFPRSPNTGRPHHLPPLTFSKILSRFPSLLADTSSFLANDTTIKKCRICENVRTSVMESLMKILIFSIYGDDGRGRWFGVVTSRSRWR